MFVLHVALQGCLKGRNVAYGITADTGGHIRYLLDLVNAVADAEPGARAAIATRLFRGEWGEDYARPREAVREGVEILRFATSSPDYLPKEELWREVPSFTEALVDWIQAQPVRPDLLHAHYADAASVAAIVEERLGIPFVFTAHSLGRVKSAVMAGRLDRCEAHARRIETEERALSRAALVIASSRDEAEVQYADYRAYDPGRIRILPPGSDLDRFRGAATDPEVSASIDRFLAVPEKPAVLAIARPVRKKNLTALVHAFGRSAELRERANLVLMAGSRERIDELEPELAAEMREILALVDRYDLYGHVSYPKTHRPEDVPAIYAHARERRGVFANPALNEPFGLTLLEASAVGLPIVATDSGGPNDIVEMCRNGLLVDPNSTDAIADGLLAILRDGEAWERFAAAGAKAADAYDWKRHAVRYGELLRSLKRREPPQRKPAQLLICDIDNTLIGCDESIRFFGGWRRAQAGLAFGVATGRSFHSAMAILEQQDAPRPQVMITSVGSEIHHLEANGTTYRLDADWRRIVSAEWDREAVRRALDGLAGIRPQAPLEQRRHKLSYFSDGERDVADRVKARLEERGLRASVIHSHGRYLDVLPVRASKGTAVEFVRRSYGLPSDGVFVAGDSGNDIEMLRTVPQSIIVANFSDDLASLPGLQHSYVAQEKFARGIVEGVLHFRDRKAAVLAKRA